MQFEPIKQAAAKSVPVNSFSAMKKPTTEMRAIMKWPGDHPADIEDELGEGGQSLTFDISLKIVSNLG